MTWEELPAFERLVLEAVKMSMRHGRDVPTRDLKLNRNVNLITMTSRVFEKESKGNIS